MTVRKRDVLKYSLIESKLSLSPSHYEEVVITNRNCKSLKELIDNKFTKGKEVGSDSYIEKSKKIFLRTKALQQDNFLLDITKESAIPIKPQSFLNHNLKKGMIIISKDSNIGEVAYLEKDYPHYMLCAGLVSIEVPQHPFYIMGFLKSKFFKAQLNAMISKGTIIKHAKMLFLDCEIPFPNVNAEETIKFIEETTKSIIRRESTIRAKYQQISDAFEHELFSNCQKQKLIQYIPRYSEIIESTRLDTGLYEVEYQRLINCITSYKNGHFTISSDQIKSGSTPKRRIMGIGVKKWITPSIFDELGYFTADERIHCKKNNITKDCVIIKNRTLKEKLGRFVGTAAFYNFGKLGIGHHNQGCYRVEDYSPDELKFIALVLNTQVYRRVCGYLSLGSKMREIKMNQFTSLPFPKFTEKIKKQLIKLYDHDLDLPNNRCVSIKKLESFDSEKMESFGIIQLASQMHYLKRILWEAIQKIVDDVEFDCNFVTLPQ